MLVCRGDARNPHETFGVTPVTSRDESPDVRFGCPAGHWELVTLEALAQRDDADLAAAAADGDEDAFAVLAHRHGPAVFRYVVRTLGDRVEAEDVVQDTFVAAWQGLDRFDGRSAVRTWLFSIASHKTADRFRRRRPVPYDDDALPEPAAPAADRPAVRAEGSAFLADLEIALASLPWRQRACWLLVEVEGLSQPEVARVLSTTPDTVRGQLFRARRALEERMAPWR